MNFAYKQHRLPTFHAHPQTLLYQNQRLDIRWIHGSRGVKCQSESGFADYWRRMITVLPKYPVTNRSPLHHCSSHLLVSMQR